MRQEGRSIGYGIPIPSTPEEFDKNDPFYGSLRIKKNSLVGHIVSSKTHKTASIVIDRQVYVKKYSRYLKRTTKIQVHNPPSINAKEGDIVKVYETKPISKTKHYVIVQIMGKFVDIKGQDLFKEAKDANLKPDVKVKTGA